MCSFAVFETTSLTTVVISISVILLVCWLSFKRQSYTLPLPPFPRIGLPIVGHLHLITKDVRECFRKFRNQCGDVYSLYFGNKLVVVISGYEAIREGFKTNGDKFPNRGYMPIIQKTVRGMGIVHTDGPNWIEHRRFIFSSLREFGMGKSKLAGKINEEAALLVTEMEALDGQPFDPKVIISTHVANIICSMSFGVNFKHDDPRFIDMLTRFDENLRSVAGMANFIPVLAWLPGDLFGVKKSLENADKIYEYCNEIIAEHLEYYDENNIDDLTSAYIKEMRRAEAAGELTSMSLEFLSVVIADLFIAGSETTTTALRWALVILVEYPDVQLRLYNEICKSIGTERNPSFQDRTALKYVEAFYTEVLRFCNVVITAIPHAAPEDIVFRGYTIPSDALVVPDIDSVLMDAKVWIDPEVFRPDRFLDETGNLEKREDFLAFFTGKRSCIGESLARMELLLFLTTMVQNFKFENPEGENLSMATVDGVFGIVHAAKPFKIVARKRI